MSRRPTRRQRRAPMLAALAVLAATAASGREPVPPLGTPRPLHIPARTETVLANGLRLTLIDTGLVPKATIMIDVRTGSIDEGPHNGLADFAGDYLTEGAGGRTATELAAAAADMGGAIGVSIGTDRSAFTLDVLSEKAPAAIALLADVIRRPDLPAQSLPKLRANALRALAVARTEPQQIAGDALRRAIYGTHRYGRGLPTDADVGGYTVEEVRRFLSANLGARRAHVYVAGRFDHAAVASAVRSAFGDWQAGPAPGVDVPAPAGGRRVILIDRPGAPQSTIMIGAPGIDPTVDDYVPLSVTTTLLGGGLLSRYNQELREARGWTYGVQARLSPTYRSGLWMVSTDVTTAHTAEAVAALLRGLADLKATPPGEDELRRTQNLRAGSFAVGIAGRASLLGQLAFLDLHGLPDDWLAGYVQRVYAVRPADTSTVLARRIDEAAMTIVVLGDRKAFEPALRALPPLVSPATTWLDGAGAAPSSPNPR
jgi:zinc protease